MSDLKYLKVEGIGNDFLLLDRLAASPDALRVELTELAERAPALCDRGTGVGADGILVVAPATSEAAAQMIVINHDGSRPEMCGNGLRCVAHWLALRPGLHRQPSAAFDVQTDAGDLRCELLEELGEGKAQVSVDMGPARFLGNESPVAGQGRSFASVSMGNPHAIAFVDREDPEQLARTLGPALEVDPAYPERSNIEFARVDDDGGITLWVWERGCGITQACGTGACASAAAAVRQGLLPAQTWIPVRLPGGVLSIWVPQTGADDAQTPQSVRMRGPSWHVGPGVA